MNQQYKIDYRVEQVDGKRWMMVLLHKENADRNYRFRIQQYIDAKVFPGNLFRLAGGIASRGGRHTHDWSSGRARRRAGT